jgi:hypothetical protein
MAMRSLPTAEEFLAFDIRNLVSTVCSFAKLRLFGCLFTALFLSLSWIAAMSDSDHDDVEAGPSTHVSFSRNAQAGRQTNRADIVSSVSIIRKNDPWLPIVLSLGTCLWSAIHI